MTHIKESADHEVAAATTTETTTTANESVEAGLNNLSTKERARRVLEEGRITVDTKLHTFTVMGTTCPRLVILFPKETCTCSSSKQCYHIIAAKLAIGKKLDDSKKKINLAELHRNIRSRGSKKSGRKRPHPSDCEVIPAPDAMGPAQNPEANLSSSIGDNANVSPSSSSTAKQSKEAGIKSS